MVPFEFNCLADQSARYLAFCLAMGVPNEPKTPEQARDAEIARLLAFSPNALPEVLALSQVLLAERDFVAGCQPGVSFDVDSLAQHFQTDSTTMLSACKLVGAMPCQWKGQAVWADDTSFRFTLDSGAIEWANT